MFVTDDYSSQGVSTEDGADSADDDEYVRLLDGWWHPYSLERIYHCCSWLHITRDFHKGKRSIKPLPQRMLD